MSISHDIEEAVLSNKKMKKPKHAIAIAQVVASAGNTKVKTANNDDSDDTAIPTFIISSSSKTIIHSILTMFAVYDKISTQHKIDGADAISHDIASSHIKLDFKLVKRAKNAHEIAIVERNASSKGVRCTSLRDMMESRTTAMSYQRVLRMAEMIYEQMVALEALGLAPPYYGLDDILVINETFFCFINDAKLFQIENTAEKTTGSNGSNGSNGSKSNNRIDVTRAISRTAAFFAPELIGGISALPYSADVRSSYYSYGLLVAYCATLNSKLLTTHENKNHTAAGAAAAAAAAETDDEEKDEENGQQFGGKRNKRRHGEQHTHTSTDIVRALEPLQYTKLYWLILRCCDPDVSRRSIIYV
jgi:hypothetical protein